MTMDFDLPEEVRLLKETVKRFVERELIPIEMEAMDGPDMKPDVRANLEARARDLGLWLLDVPEEYGGLGLSLVSMAVVWEEVSRTIAMPPRGPLVFGPDPKPVMYELNAEQKERYLLPLIQGRKKAAFAQTEPDAGADPGSMRTTAVRKGDRYILNGTKRFITHAGDADFLQVVAATDRTKGSRGGLVGRPAPQSEPTASGLSPGRTHSGQSGQLDQNEECKFKGVRRER
jgi:acyl-CoA dehydrogenase